MRNPQKDGVAGLRGFGAGLLCVAALLGVLGLSGCSSDEMSAAGEHAIDELAAGVEEVDQALDAFDVQPDGTSGSESSTVSK